MKTYKKPQIMSMNFMREVKLGGGGEIVPVIAAAAAAGFMAALAAGGRDVNSKKVGLPTNVFLHPAAAF